MPVQLIKKQMLNIRLVKNLSGILTISLVSLMPLLSPINPQSEESSSSLSSHLFLQSAHAQQSDFAILDSLKCGDDCLQLPIDNRFRNDLISQRLINQLPKWSNICQKLTNRSFCSVAKTYRFKDGTISLKVVGTEVFFTDIKFDSGISSARATAIAKQSFNYGKNYVKTENLKGRIVLYSNPYDNGDQTIYLQETYLILNSRNQVNRIFSASTTP